MKLSELINKAQKALDEVGDVDVCIDVPFSRYVLDASDAYALTLILRDGATIFLVK